MRIGLTCKVVITNELSNEIGYDMFDNSFEDYIMNILEQLNRNIRNLDSDIIKSSRPILMEILLNDWSDKMFFINATIVSIDKKPVIVIGLKNKS